MAQNSMHLEILSPAGVFLNCAGVERVSVKTKRESFCILPHRLDCVAVLSPGEILFSCENSKAVRLWVGAGILTKLKSEVLISVRSVAKEKPQ
jgi:F-type H+-transporting ATPase subunit epsilon